MAMKGVKGRGGGGGEGRGRIEKMTMTTRLAPLAFLRAPLTLISSIRLFLTPSHGRGSEAHMLRSTVLGRRL